MMGGSGVKRLGHTVPPDADPRVRTQAPRADIHADRSRAIPTLRLRLLEFNDTKVQLRADRYVSERPLRIISELCAACVLQRRSIPRMFGRSDQVVRRRLEDSHLCPGQLPLASRFAPPGSHFGGS